MASEAVIAKCRKLCKTYDVDYSFGTKLGGFAHPWNNYIYVCTNDEDTFFISTVFHEIQHVINYRKGKYKVYHNGRMTQSQFKRWALPAEIYTDKMAKKLAESHGFKGYIVTYKNDKQCKAFLNDYMKGLLK